MLYFRGDGGERPLSTLVAQLPGARQLWGGDPKISGICTDSRHLTPGHLYLAIVGGRYDGHQFIPQVVKGGAAALLVEVPPQRQAVGNIAVIQVENTRLALAHLASSLYQHPARSLACIGVTGTTGKTTTSFLLNAILERAGLKTGLLGTVCQKVGSSSRPSELTTPEPLELHRLFAAMKEQGVSHAIMEVSSHSLCQERVAGVPFRAAVFTNLSREHLDYHKSFSHYLDSKARLFSSLGPRAHAILNYDEAASRHLQQVTRAQTIGYGKRGGAQLMATKICPLRRGFSFRLSLTRPIKNQAGRLLLPGQWPVKLSLLGRHNIANALGASAAALALGIEPEAIISALEDFPGAPRRLELVYEGPFTIIDDFGHNEASLEAVFTTLTVLHYRKLIIVNYLKGTRGVAANEITARHIAHAARRLRLAKVISTRSDSHVIVKNRVQDEEERAFSRIIKKAGLSITTTRELPDAIALGLASVGAGDILLLLGPSGMDAGAKIALDFLQEATLPAAAQL
ncbi:MAG: UDP-N-acetylmuramyl-tripeptide synthetase [Firmicutes bacterium]|nr:UDP-N-acetylmuramyl-tripeptide synthetase [Bacillota bacterium]